MVNVSPKTSAASRLWRHVEKTERCWVWRGARAGGPNAESRYGVIGETRDKMVYTHRVAWEAKNGPIPAGMKVLHHCDNPICVKTEPDEQWPEGHLFLGTSAENTADMIAKGRQAKGERHPNSILTEDQVRTIRSSFEKQRVLAQRFGVSQMTVSDVRTRRTWKSV